MEAVKNEPRLSNLPGDDPVAEVPAPPGPSPAPERRSAHVSHHRRSKARWWLPLFLALAIAAIVSIMWQPSKVSAPQTTAKSVEETEPPPPKPAEPRYPIEATAAALPPLDASDATLLAALQGAWGGSAIASFLEPRHLARNFVATVDNIPRKTMPVRTLPWRPASGTLATRGNAEAMVINDSNALRYGPYVKLVNAIEPTALVAVYVRHYPLFQQAYRELGYPDGHFNDRLVEAIDVLLDAPEPATMPRVIQPKVFYEFADRNLESLPAGQKLMIRLGPENERLVKAKLVELRKLVTAERDAVSAAQPR